jgi:flavin reductase (DIM6/NTAB) family NADH-FMN oxidoreductase RutF
MLVNPRQTVLVTCRSGDKDNIIALDWHMPTSFSPELYCISIGKTRFSHRLVSESKVFVVNFMPYELRKKVLYCGRSSGRNVDKFKSTGLEKEEASAINCPRIKQALAFLECRVVKEVDTGDHTIFVGEVVNSWERKKGKRIFHLGGDEFTTTES